MKYFETRFMEEANKFIAELDPKAIRKIFYNIDLAEQTNDPKLLAFWDKSDNKETLVIATHGFIKKVDKVPANEINRAIRLRDKYFNNKF